MAGHGQVTLFSGSTEAMVTLMNGVRMPFGFADQVLGWPLGGIAPERPAIGALWSPPTNGWSHLLILHDRGTLRGHKRLPSKAQILATLGALFLSRGRCTIGAQLWVILRHP